MEEGAESVVWSVEDVAKCFVLHLLSYLLSHWWLVSGTGEDQLWAWKWKEEIGDVHIWNSGRIWTDQRVRLKHFFNTPRLWFCSLQNYDQHFFSFLAKTHCVGWKTHVM